ncbi:exopolysaccharide biosynthesis GT4 family glycosyltransferase EpsE [Paracoccus yeei]|uniref:exopolysaccharide biosynthesis GT4 family glycosyltransferase EpsE n=1 Tax=Paracoccus yeei TaxID=147645 RepID=UPI00048B06AE|nr:exopolysaccharide biosynthesis GT4 family glycosyltransferase EpsE [Paracoccus yeei]OWJ92327.1 colanic acid biosynthesis glycosyltransferase WcaL [Paracoccus yeei]
MPLRLGYLIPQFPGQTHIFFWRELEALQARGVQPVLLSTRPPPPGLISHEWSAEAAARTTYLARMDPAAALGGLVRLPPGDLLSAPRGEPRAFLRDMAMSIPAARRLVDHARREGIDHVHAHSCGRAALIAALAFRMGGPRYSLTLHGPLEDYGPGQRYKWRHAAFATIITEKLRAEAETELAGYLPPRIAVQAMGVDTGRLSRDTPWQPPRPGEPLRIMSCGRLNQVKGHQDLLQAIRMLRDAGHDARLVVAGEDDAGGTGYRRVIEARIAELGLDDAVTLLGAVSEGEVRRHLLEAHVFALASWHEPLGVALMEAMSCEVPTIGTAAGGVAELIRDGQDGILVPPRDPPAMADAILRLAGDPNLARRLGQAGRERIVSGFGAEAGAETLIRLVAETRG